MFWKSTYNEFIKIAAKPRSYIGVGAITLIGTLIAGVMYLATQDYRVGANTLNESRAEAAAEMGLNRIMTDWDISKNTSFWNRVFG